MFFRTMTAVVMTVFLSGSPLGAAADENAEAGVANAVIMVRLFANTCLRHWNGRDHLPEFVAEGGQFPLPEVHKELTHVYMDGGSGRAWMFVAETGVFALALNDDGRCKLFARRADEASLVEELKSHFAAQTFFAVEDAGSDRRGVVGLRFQRVLPGGSARHAMRMTLSTTTETEDVGYQATLTLGLPGEDGK